MSVGWRVWRAFDGDAKRDDQPLFRALIQSCKGSDGRLDVVEYEHWLDVFVWYRRGES